MLSTFISLLSFTYNIANVAADFPAFRNSSEYSDGKYGANPTQKYITEPDFQTPVGNILTEPQSGAFPAKNILWAPGGPKQFIPVTGPMIVDATTLNTVWQGPVYAIETIGLAVQECNASQYLTFWAGHGWMNGKAGRSYIINDQYKLMYNISAMGGLRHADCHEIYLTPRCTAIITVYDPHPYDLTAYNITDGWLLDSYFQEIDLATNELLYTWRASDYVNVSDTLWTPDLKHSGHLETHAFDWFHINSVEKDSRGNYLISARHTNAIYYISGANGQVIWTLGGPRNDFRDLSDGKAIGFSWQHHARWVDANMTQISLFDDRNSLFHHSDRPGSRGMVVALDYTAKTVTLVNEWVALHNATSEREGSMQVLPNGNALIGLGEDPAMSEYSADGRVVWDVAFGPFGFDRQSADNYRIMKTNWTGAPRQGPKIAAGPAPVYEFIKKESLFQIRQQDEQGNDLAHDTVYLSWNGATEAVNWVMLASNDTTDLTIADHYWTMVPKDGFEANVRVGESARYVQALATDVNDRVLHVTPVIDMADGHLEWTAFEADKLSDDLGAQMKSAALMDDIKEKWTQVKEAGTTRNLGVLTAILGLAVTLTVAICLVRRSRRRAGYMRANRGDDGGEAKYVHQKYMDDIDLRSITSSQSSMSEDLKAVVPLQAYAEQ